MPKKNLTKKQKQTEAEVQKEVARRGGAIKVRTIHPNPKRPDEFAHVYVVRKKGPRGGKTVRGIIQRKDGTGG